MNAIGPQHSRRPTLWTAPALLSMNAGCQNSFTETAVKPARVAPAANGCCAEGQRFNTQYT